MAGAGGENEIGERARKRLLGAPEAKSRPQAMSYRGLFSPAPASQAGAGRRAEGRPIAAPIFMPARRHREILHIIVTSREPARAGCVISEIPGP